MALKFKWVINKGQHASILAIDEIRNGIIGDVYKGEAYYSNNRGSIGIGKIVQF